jgi:hypothetical protein
MMAKASTMPSITISIEGRPFYGNINATCSFATLNSGSMESDLIDLLIEVSEKAGSVHADPISLLLAP